MKDKTLKKPLFTVVTITLNNLSGLQKTYKSIQNQSFENFEWLIIDGESTDGTIDFLKSQKSNPSSPFITRYTSEKDTGIYDAMNKGIQYAYGKYIIFMNAGDEFATPKTLENIAPHTEKSPDFIYGDALEPDKNGKNSTLKKAKQYKKLPWGMFTHHQAMIYNRQTIQTSKIRYSLLYDIASDYDFTARFLIKSKKIIYIPHPFCIFEQGGISQQNAYKGRREQFLIREKLNMVSTQENVLILGIQTLSWHLKSYAPWLYSFLKALLIKTQ